VTAAQHKYIDLIPLRRISCALSANTYVVSLDVRWNNISSAAVQELSVPLANNKTVRTVLLDGNQIDNDGAVSLARMLQSNRAITSLSLSNNRIDHHGAAQLLLCLRDNDTMSSLRLDDNPVECVQWVRELVASSLQHLAVECEFQSSLSQHVISAVPFCLALRRLDINVMTFKQEKQLREALARLQQFREGLWALLLCTFVPTCAGAILPYELRCRVVDAAKQLHYDECEPLEAVLLRIPAAHESRESYDRVPFDALKAFGSMRT